MSEKKERKSLKSLFELREGKDVNGFFVQTEKLIIDGEMGITIKYYSVTSKDKQKKVSIKGNKDGTFSIIFKENGKDKDMKPMSKDELVKFVKADADLGFVADFLKTQKGGAWLSRPAKHGSKKGSKKSSKKAPKKASKKGSKKH